MPIWLRWQEVGASVSGDVRDVVLLARRLSIAGIMALGYLYYTISGGGAALAAIGLIAFAGVAQMLPSLVGGLFWRGATRAGALAGLTVGFAVGCTRCCCLPLGVGFCRPVFWPKDCSVLVG
jgi:Na+/proline symporter